MTLNPIRAIHRRFLGASLAIYFGVLMPMRAKAQNTNTSDLDGVMDRVTSQLSGAGALISTVAAVIGFALVAFGIFKLVMRKPGGQDSIGSAVGMIIGGALLLVVGTVASIGSNTVVNEDAGGLGNIGIGD